MHLRNILRTNFIGVGILSQKIFKVKHFNFFKSRTDEPHRAYFCAKQHQYGTSTKSILCSTDYKRVLILKAPLKSGIYNEFVLILQNIVTYCYILNRLFYSICNLKFITSNNKKLRTKMDKILTIIEIAEKLKVSKHTIQAWVSPSSPNHNPEFANLARHAGRKTVFFEEEIDRWLNQRKGAMYSIQYGNTSAYWREKFIHSKGLFEGILKVPTIEEKTSQRNFKQGKLAFDYEPLLAWLSNSKETKEIEPLIEKAEGLILASPLVWWFLRKMWRSPKHLKTIKKFLLDDNIFEIAPMNEESLKRSLELPTNAGELSIQAYACSNVAGASSLLTSNPVLLKTKGLNICSL